MKGLAIAFSVFASLAGFAFIGGYMYFDVTESPTRVVCTEEPGTDQFYGCTKDLYRRELETGYGEAKDLGKSFLTLISAVFVASITFSEKIIDLKSSGKWPRAAMILCWAFLLLAIGACGAAFVYMGFAVMLVVRHGIVADHNMNRAIQLFASSGLFFGLGLLMMLLAALPSVVTKTQAESGSH